MIGIRATGTVCVLLSGCAGFGSINPGQVSGSAASLFGIPSATISTQFVQELVEIQAVAAQLQMLKAQLDGTPVILPTIPPPVVVNPSPTPVTPVPPPVVTPTLPGPVVTPNFRSQKRHGEWRDQIAATAMLNAEQIR